MAGIYVDLTRFVEQHRRCGKLTGDADAVTTEGYRLWLSCARGARFERWVTVGDADADLIGSDLPAIPN